ncbi:hypothetical protein [Halalkalicoccus subterraneus]|uniref:hypothetical protein n=1 Tax=Halalkalicoccus subterraneus TaxID=2675002 RepID=UPI000EFAE7CC|nr:hypothetical protein [Halalkalicoccus subterraneus]
MATDTTISREEPPAVTSYLGTIRRSKPLLGIVFGLVLVAVGLILQVGVMAGMMGIYGVSAILVSTAAYVALRVLRRET